MKTYSTKEAAKLAGIHWVTLHRWLGAGKIRPSIGVRMNGSTLWRWTAADVRRVRKLARPRKARGQKQKRSTKKQQPVCA